MKQELLHEKINFTNIRELIEWAANAHVGKYAYSFRADPRAQEITKITFEQLRDDVRALACALSEMGCAGKHCVTIGKFSYDWALIYFAVQAIGGVLVPLDCDWHKEDLADTVQKADANFLFCDESFADKAEYIANQTSLDAEPFYLLARKHERNLASLLETGRDAFTRSPDAYFKAEIDPHKMSLLVFTSGTTGQGKGVMLSQEAVISDLADIVPYIDFADKTVGVLPPHHTYGSSVMLIGHTIIGCEIYISSGLRYIQKELQEQKPGHLILVPLYLENFYRKIQANIKAQGKTWLVATMIKVSNGLRKVGIDLRKKFFGTIRAAFGGEVHMIISGGAPLNPEILNFFESIGISTLNGYGITECAPIVAVNRSRRVVHGSVGPVLDMDTVIIKEPNEHGEGEICVKGANVMLGYYKNAEATAEAIDGDGFFHTGDYGKLDKNNVLYITGRKKNLIILSNGKNVYPEEIENELVATPGIADIVVYEGQSARGISHNKIVAEVYPDKEYVETNAITDVYSFLKPYIDAYNRNAVSYKKIGLLKVREEEFPKNTLRKIMRFKLDTSIE